MCSGVLRAEQQNQKRRQQESQQTETVSKKVAVFLSEHRRDLGRENPHCALGFLVSRPRHVDGSRRGCTLAQFFAAVLCSEPLQQQAAENYDVYSKSGKGRQCAAPFGLKASSNYSAHK